VTQAGTWSEAEEMAIYRAGQKVELKSSPGKIDTILAYDPMMVPPIVLANDPQPRYPEELELINSPHIFSLTARHPHPIGVLGLVWNERSKSSLRTIVRLGDG
jgi:hypothetical protein